MPNQNYLKGRRKEYKIKKKFELAGYTVLRTAGSHGFADLVAVDYRKKEIVFIQCKPDNFSETETNKLIEEYVAINGEYKIKFEVI